MTRAKEIVQEWLDASVTTAAAGKHAEHRSLISRKVSFLGVPGFAAIKYDDWSFQCKDEFEEDLVKKILYEATEVVAVGMKLTMFRAVETVEVSDGPVDKNGIEAVLENESDGQWRLTQERVLSADEVERYAQPLR